MAIVAVVVVVVAAPVWFDGTTSVGDRLTSTGCLAVGVALIGAMGYGVSALADHLTRSPSDQRRAARRRLLAAVRCPACDYDLRESPDRCPECGWWRPAAEPSADEVADRLRAMGGSPHDEDGR